MHVELRDLGIRAAELQASLEAALIELQSK